MTKCTFVRQRWYIYESTSKQCASTIQLVYDAECFQNTRGPEKSAVLCLIKWICLPPRLTFIWKYGNIHVTIWQYSYDNMAIFKWQYGNIQMTIWQYSYDNMAIFIYDNTGYAVRTQLCFLSWDDTDCESHVPWWSIPVRNLTPLHFTLRLPFLAQQDRILWFETRPCPQKDPWSQKLFLAPVNCGYSNLVVLRTFVGMACCSMSVLYTERKVTQEKEKWGSEFIGWVIETKRW